MSTYTDPDLFQFHKKGVDNTCDHADTLQVYSVYIIEYQ